MDQQSSNPPSKKNDIPIEEVKNPTSQVQPVQESMVSQTTKEHEPLPSSSINSEALRQSIEAPKLTPEVTEAGVKESESAETHPMPKELVDLGVEHAPEAQPVISQPTGKITLPDITDVQATQMVKESNPKEQKYWLGKYILRQMKVLFATSKKQEK